MHDRYLVIGPLPPAIGGIATIVGSLQEAFEGDSRVAFLDTTKATDGSRSYLRPIKSLIQVVVAAASTRKGTVLMFSSSQASFWEKCFWCAIFRLVGWRTVIQMVDGGFPQFFNQLSAPAKWVASIVIRNADIIAAQSPFWQEFYEGIFPTTTVTTVSPGTDTNFFIPPAERKAADDIEVLYVGWLIEAKGIYDLIDAAQILMRNGGRFKVKLIGPAFGAESKILGYVNSRDANNVIEIGGPVTSREMIRSMYQAADIFVLPSHFEGFPYALMEAVSSGLPCVGTRVGGIPDILDNGRCGILVDRRSPGQLAEAVSKLMADAKYRVTLGERARQRATREYSLQKSLNDYKHVLKMASDV